jgi:hypothetical protein
MLKTRHGKTGYFMKCSYCRRNTVIRTPWGILILNNANFKINKK